VRSAALALAREGAEVHVVAPGGDVRGPPRRLARDEAAPGALWLHHAGGGSLFGWPGALARTREAPWRLSQALPFAAGVRRRLAAIGPVERTIAHWIVPSAFPLATLARAIEPGSLEVVAHGADVRALCGAPRALRELVVRTLLARATAWTFTSEASRSLLAAALAPELAAPLLRASRLERPLLALPDVSARARSLREALRLTPEQPLFVTAGRLVRAKRIDLAIDAVSCASRHRPRLVIVGDGPERDRLQRRAARTGDNVTFTGLLGRTDTLAWIAAADVLLHPSAEESAPCVVREARALGVPVIACAAGDVTTWAERDDGLCVVPAVAAAIAEAMHRSRDRRRAETAPMRAQPRPD
jgi:glycosyltransferase involved in cell wall biosynthesis